MGPTAQREERYLPAWIVLALLLAFDGSRVAVLVSGGLAAGCVVGLGTSACTKSSLSIFEYLAPSSMAIDDAWFSIARTFGSKRR